MSVNQPGSDTTTEADADTTNRAVELVKTLSAAVLVAGWSLFWANVAKVHYTMGDLLSAGFTAATLVVPAIALFGWYAAESHGYDVPTPDVDATVIGS